MNDNTWLQELKAGDTVLVSRHPYEDIRTVKRVTPTQIVVVVSNYEERFRKSDGWEIGGRTYNRRFLRHATPEKIAELKRQETRGKHIRAIQNAKLDALTDSQLERIAAILVEGKE
jgi:flagellar motor switch protein FliG